jgi:hypothetical protein
MPGRMRAASRGANPRTPEEQSRDRLFRHRYGELVEVIAEEESFATRVTFGCLGCYLHGRLVLVLAAGERPWDGVLVPMAREQHAALRESVPALRPHPVLGKWLYIPASAETFEADAGTLAALARANDARIGVEPAPRRTGRHAGRASRGMRRRR